jgi:1-acyl-sn-glycerol-3-phosphate acyltransferase
MTYLLSVGLNWKFKLDPRLAQLAGQPSCTIVVANHHSPLDIYVLMHALAANPPHFICRPGLERGLPFISLYVRHACAVLTGEPERNDALISLLGKRVAASNGVAILFPEGRKNAKNYAPILPFMPSGLDKLVAAAPDARVVAVAIKGTHAAWPGPWKLPKPGAVIEVLIADPVQTDLAKHTQLARQCETAIRRTLASAAANVPRAEAP